MGQSGNGKKSKHGRSYRSIRTKSPLQLPLMSTSTSLAVVTTAAVLLIIISIYINLPWLQFFWLEVMPSLWRLVCRIFTPRNLFIVLNTLILSILALAHLQNRSTSSEPPQPFSSQAVAAKQYQSDHDRRSIDKDRNDYQSESMKLNEDEDIDSELNSSADEFSPSIEVFFNDVEQRAGAILSGHPKHNEMIDDDNNADCSADERSLISANRGFNHPISYKASVAKIFNASAAAIAAESSAARLQLLSASEIRRMQHWSCSSDAEEDGAVTKSGKAKKATSAEQGGVDVDGTFNMAEKKATSAQESPRPLASAHFTRKKAIPYNDRPLSPLRTILKRGDTLEATWKAICESKRHHHSKHEAHIHHGHSRVKPRASSPSLLSPLKQRHKPTINNMLHHGDDELSRPRLLRKREPSIPQEELNAKVESFISRFNAQIKMQREKSLLDYMEMVGRGAS
ncbi:hypothetical protein L7F22_045374 [Adiantum nelumboides]|nr:hypothetical protein [Adiantum nelumboides]